MSRTELEAQVTDSLESRVLYAMNVGLDSVDGLRISLNEGEADVRAVLAELTASGLVRAGELGDVFVLTHAGSQMAKNGGISSTPGRSSRTGTSFFQIRTGRAAADPGWSEVSGMVAHAWNVTQSANSIERQPNDEEMLVGDAEREVALDGLSRAYGEGRLDQSELDRRTDLALHALTRGDLDAAFDDLPKTAPSKASARPTTFAFVAILSIPIAVLGLILLGKADPGDKLLGAALLAVLGPGLFVLASWAFPRGPAGVRRHWHH